MIYIVLSSDPSVTPHNVIPVFQALIGNWDMIGSFSIVPPARAQLFEDKLHTRDKLTEAAGKYFTLYYTIPSWKWLSVCLYRSGETEALKIAMPHIQTVRGTCTTCISTVIFWVHVG